MDSDASSRTPVADSETVSGFQIGVVMIGISITLPLLYSAGELVQGIDLITMVDHETSSPINSERVHCGQRVTIFGIGCPPHYRTEKALKVVAPRAFGFDYCPIESL